MSASGVFLDRMRANAASALATGEVTLPTVLAHLISVSRQGNRPTSLDHLDALDVTELVDTLNQMRATAPGEVTDGGVRARYDGECSVCGQVIRRRDRLVWVDPETAVHEHCADDGGLAPTVDVLDPNRQPKRPTCPRCWTAVSVTGACECTDD